MLEHGAISTSSPSDGPPRSVLDRTNDGRFETQSLIVPGGLKGQGNRSVAGFREVLDAQVGADAQRYLKAGNALIGLRGTDLQNYVGVALDLAPNVMPVRGAGNQLLYKGEALQAVSTVSDAIRAAGGEAPQVRAVPVYLRVADDKMAKTTIFRVQGRDGRERIVDNVGRTYESLQKWRENNQLGAVDVFLPQGGQLRGRDGKVVLEAFNNRRFDNTALPVLRGGVAILGAGAGVAVMLGSGGVAAPLVMAGGAVFSVADSGATLADRAWHGQTLGLNDQQARAAWLDFVAGLLGAGAIGTGAKALARASDLADLLTLGNGVGDLASDWDKLSPGERALAGAQLAFWASMLGASQFSGGRFNLDPLLARGGGGDVGTRGGDPAVNTTRPRGRGSDGTKNTPPMGVTGPGPSSFVPSRVTYAKGTPLTELVAARLAASVPGLDVNPTGSALNCLNAAVALDRQLAGAPAVATPLTISEPDDLFDLYGRLPEQGFGARGPDGGFLLGAGERFSLRSLQQHLVALPQGARGIVLVSYGQYGQGHALVVRNEGGRAVFLDGQSGAVIDPRALSTGAIALPDALNAYTRGKTPRERDDITYLFLRTDDVPTLSPLAPGVGQGIAIDFDKASRRVEIVDPRTGDSRWVQVTPAEFEALAGRQGLNVYLWQTRAADGRARQHVSSSPPWEKRAP
jgi:hypothetical protein